MFHYIWKGMQVANVPPPFHSLTQTMNYPTNIVHWFSFQSIHSKPPGDSTPKVEGVMLSAKHPTNGLEL